MKAKRWTTGLLAAVFATVSLPAQSVLADEDVEAVDVLAEDTPNALTHQGRLVDDESQPIVGDIELTYTIWDHPTEGSVLWQDAVEVELDDTGFYSVELGDGGNPIDASVVADGQGWLGVSVDGDDELDPRISLNAVPYALVAEEALRAGEAQFADAASWADFADEAGFAEEAAVAAGVEDGSIGSEALADDFQVDAEHVEEATGQTLGGMACSSGEVAQFDGTDWRCEDSIEHAEQADHAEEADEAQLAAAVEDGAIGSDALAADFSVTTDQIDGETIGGLSCANGDIARFDGNSWHCDDDPTEGAVTEVSASGPVVSTGGTEPTISLPRADASTDGYLHADDFASFDDRVESVDAGDGIAIDGTDTSPEVAVQFGDQPGMAVEGDDERLSDPREPEPGHDHYIQNDPGAPQTASFDIDGDGAVGGQFSVGDDLSVDDGTLAVNTDTTTSSSSGDDEPLLRVQGDSQGARTLLDRGDAQRVDLQFADDDGSSNIHVIGFIAQEDDLQIDDPRALGIDSSPTGDGTDAPIQLGGTDGDAYFEGDVQMGGYPVMSDFPVASGYTTDDFSPGDRFVYDEIYVNNGGFYDESTGEFTAPVDGVYEMCASTRRSSDSWTMLNTMAGGEVVHGDDLDDRWLQARDRRGRQNSGCISFEAAAGDAIANYVGTSNDGAECSSVGYCFFNVKLIAATP